MGRLSAAVVFVWLINLGSALPADAQTGVTASAASVIGTTVDVTFSSAIQCGLRCQAGISIHSADGTQTYSIGNAGLIAPDVMRLSLLNAVHAGEDVALDYDGEQSLADAAGNPLAAFTISVTNATGTSTVTPLNGTVVGATVDLAFSAPIQCGLRCQAGISIHSADGTQTYSIGNAGMVSADLMRLSLLNAVHAGENVVLDYDGEQSLADNAGNPLNAFTIALTNATGITTVTAVAGTVLGTTVDLRFSDVIQCGLRCQAGISIHSPDGTQSYSVGNAGMVAPDLMRLSLLNAVHAGENVVLDYDGEQSLADSAGTPLLAFGVPLTNLLTPAVDVTTLLKITESKPRKDKATSSYLQTIRLRNSTSQEFAGPLTLIVDGLHPSVHLTQSGSATSCTVPVGSPYVEAEIGLDGVFTSREQISVTLEFENPTDQVITHSIRVLVGPGCR